MVCQRAIAKQVIEQNGDYVLGMKGNQSKLHEAVEGFFVTAQTNDFRGINYGYYKEELDKAHGRLETRRYSVSDVLLSLPDSHKWKGLKSIGVVKRECLQGGIKSLSLAKKIERLHGVMLTKLKLCFQVIFNVVALLLQFLTQKNRHI